MPTSILIRRARCIPARCSTCKQIQRAFALGVYPSASRLQRPMFHQRTRAFRSRQRPCLERNRGIERR